MKVGIRMGQNLIMVFFYHEHSGLKDIYEGLGEVTKSLTTMCKHLSIQLSENEGDIIKYCERIKIKNIVVMLISFYSRWRWYS